MNQNATEISNNQTDMKLGNPGTMPNGFISPFRTVGDSSDDDLASLSTGSSSSTEDPSSLSEGERRDFGVGGNDDGEGEGEGAMRGSGGGGGGKKASGGGEGGKRRVSARPVYIKVDGKKVLKAASPQRIVQWLIEKEMRAFKAAHGS